MMNFRLAYWSVVSCILMLIRNAATAEECSASNIDTGKGKITCFNVQDDGIAVYDAALAMHEFTQILLFNTELSVMNSKFLERLAAADKIEMLAVSHGDLSKIEGHSFGRFKGLHQLNLAFNKIGDVSEKAFTDNTNLKSISLMYNAIEQLKANTFSTLLDLESVDLTRNRLHALDERLFSANVNLVNLDVKFNNLKEISEVMFRALAALERLDLSHNQIEIIPPHVFTFNYALRTLNLQGNKIQFVDFAFVHLGLSELNLLENPLDMSSEENQRAIEHLRMSNAILRVANHTDYEEEGVKEEGMEGTAGKVVLRPSPQLKLMSVGAITFLVVVMVLTSLVVYHVHQKRSKQKLYKRYYHSSCKSTEHLQGYEQKCLTLSISEENAFFQNCQVERPHSNGERMQNFN